MSQNKNKFLFKKGFAYFVFHVIDKINDDFLLKVDKIAARIDIYENFSKKEMTVKDIEKVYGDYKIHYIADDDTSRISTDKYASVVSFGTYIFVNTPTTVDVAGAVFVIFDKTINDVNKYFNKK